MEKIRLVFEEICCKRARQLGVGILLKHSKFVTTVRYNITKHLYTISFESNC